MVPQTKSLCGENYEFFYRLWKAWRRWFFKEPLTEWFFVEPKMVLLWHRLKNLLKHLHFEECICNTYIQDSFFLETEQEKLEINIFKNTYLKYKKVWHRTLDSCQTVNENTLCFYDYYGNLQALHKHWTVYSDPITHKVAIFIELISKSLRRTSIQSDNNKAFYFEVNQNLAAHLS